MRVVNKLERDYKSPVELEALGLYDLAVSVAKNNPGQWVEAQRASITSPEHRAFWRVVMGTHDVYNWEARYPEIGVCVMYIRIPMTMSQKIRSWFK